MGRWIVWLGILGLFGASKTQGAEFLRTIKIDKSDGGSLAIRLSTRQLNPGSALRRSWYSANDGSCPVQLVRAGVTIHESPRGSYLFYVPAVASLVASEPISVFEIRFALYDVFGEYMGLLQEIRADEVSSAGPFQLKDDFRNQLAMEPKVKRKKKKKEPPELKPAGLTEAPFEDAQRLLTVISFVARATTAEGKSWRYDPGQLTPELRRVSGLKVTEAHLEPPGGAPK